MEHAHAAEVEDVPVESPPPEVVDTGPEPNHIPEHLKNKLVFWHSTGLNTSRCEKLLTKHAEAVGVPVTWEYANVHDVLKTLGGLGGSPDDASGLLAWHSWSSTGGARFKAHSLSGGFGATSEVATQTETHSPLAMKQKAAVEAVISTKRLMLMQPSRRSCASAKR